MAGISDRVHYALSTILAGLSEQDDSKQRLDEDVFVKASRPYQPASSTSTPRLSTDTCIWLASPLSTETLRSTHNPTPDTTAAIRTLPIICGDENAASSATRDDSNPATDSTDHDPSCGGPHPSSKVDCAARFGDEDGDEESVPNLESNVPSSGSNSESAVPSSQVANRAAASPSHQSNKPTGSSFHGSSDDDHPFGRSQQPPFIPEDISPASPLHPPHPPPPSRRPTPPGLPSYTAGLELARARRVAGFANVPSLLPSGPLTLPPLFCPTRSGHGVARHHPFFREAPPRSVGGVFQDQPRREAETARMMEMAGLGSGARTGLMGMGRDGMMEELDLGESSEGDSHGDGDRCCIWCSRFGVLPWRRW